MKSLCSKQSVDYHYKIVSFQKRSEASSIFILFDTRGEHAFDGGR